MSTTFKLPPTARGFLVYQRLVIDGSSTRAVAGEVGVSQTRVRQIVLRVTQWLAENLPAHDEATDAAYLRLAQHIAADRLEKLMIEASREWKATTETKFANLYLRALTALSKFPALPGTIEALLMEAIEGPLPADTNSLDESAIRNPQSEIPTPPPPRDCSPTSTAASTSTQADFAQPAPTPPPPETCINVPADTRAARSAFFSSAHRPITRTADAPVTQLQITPQLLGLSTTKKLSRNQRRRLRRSLAK